MQTIFTRFLKALGVPCTAEYSDARFRNMTFKSLFGFSHLLHDYGVKSRAVRLGDPEEIASITPPFLAQVRNGIFVIVNGFDTQTGTVSYDSLGERETMPLPDFIKAANGIVLMAFPGPQSEEPDYRSHRLTEIVQNLSGYLLAAAALFVFCYFFITRRVYDEVSTVLLTIFNCLGLFFSYLLVQKSLKIKNKVGDRVCKVLQEGGCDSIMDMKVSKLFGVFSWSEVGFGYFGISLIALLLFPHIWPSLAVCNVCCLPYTFWSIWYQRFRAHKWCTLCVGVQSTLWLLFLCYLFGGHFRGAFPLRPDTFVLIGVYVAAVLFINLLLRIFKNLPKNEENS
mgnify:FL=1